MSTVIRDSGRVALALLALGARGFAEEPPRPAAGATVKEELREAGERIKRGAEELDRKAGPRLHKLDQALEHEAVESKRELKEAARKVEHAVSPKKTPSSDARSGPRSETRRRSPRPD